MPSPEIAAPAKSSPSLSSVALPPEMRAPWLTVGIIGSLSLLFCLIGRLTSPIGFRPLVPLSDRSERFGDFTVFWGKFQFFHTADFFHRGFPFSYNAPVAVLYNLFLHHTGPHPLAVFVTFSVVALVLPAIWFGFALTRAGISGRTVSLFVATLVIFSWPAILVVDRANMEVLVWITLLIACWAYATDRLYLAAAFFGVAAALKFFPFVFLGLFLSTRDYRRLLFGVLVFLGVSVVSLYLVGPSVPVAYHGISDGVAFFRDDYMAKWHYAENSVDHSLFALYKFFAILAGHPVNNFQQSLSVYLLATAIGGLLLYILRIRHLPVLNQLLIFTIASIFFTAFSGDGTLLHLYSPFALLVFLAVGSFRARLRVPHLGTALIVLAALFTPMSFLLISNERHWRFEGQVRAVLLGLLLVLALRYGFGPSLAESRRGHRSLLASLLAPAHPH